MLETFWWTCFGVWIVGGKNSDGCILLKSEVCFKKNPERRIDSGLNFKKHHGFIGKGGTYIGFDSYEPQRFFYKISIMRSGATWVRIWWNPRVFLENISVRWGGTTGCIPSKDEGFFCKISKDHMTSSFHADEPTTVIMGRRGTMWEEFTDWCSFIKDMYITCWAWTHLSWMVVKKGSD